MSFFPLYVFCISSCICNEINMYKVLENYKYLKQTHFKLYKPKIIF